jgi:hypothetical protein
MTQKTGTLNVKWALITFILQYIAITILGFVLYYLIAMLTHVSLSATFNVLTDPAYQLSQRLMVIVNLVTWFAFAGMYFNRTGIVSTKRAWALGSFWLAIALPLDYLAFVILPSPGHLNAHDFYIGQFPWIYFVYVTVLVAPVCYLLMKRRVSAK